MKVVVSVLKVMRPDDGFTRQVSATVTVQGTGRLVSGRAHAYRNELRKPPFFRKGVSRLISKLRTPVFPAHSLAKLGFEAGLTNGRMLAMFSKLVQLVLW